LLLIAGSQAKQVLHVLYLLVQLRNKAEEPSFTFTPDFFLDAAVFRHPVPSLVSYHFLAFPSGFLSTSA
jgi:hypothetical protein